jgi:monoamine oxidase
MTHIDTIIIGGGISGLYTAMRLRKLNIPFLLLEAKSILGGRISSKPTFKNSNFSVDLGPTWFWPHQTRMIQLTKELNVGYFEQYTTGDTMYQLRNSDAPSRISGTETAQSYRIKGGMQKLINALTETLEPEIVRTNHSVTRIEYVNENWNILANGKNGVESFNAKRLIVAVPPRLILNYLTPEKYLSKKLIQALALAQTWMSGQAKFVAVYQKPFWRERGLAGHALSQVGPMIEIHDASATPDEGYALFGFIGIPSSSRKQITTEKLKSKCLQQLAFLFGADAEKPEVCYLTDWATDEYVASHNDIVEPPRYSGFSIKKHEEELLQINLHLVASEVSESEAGYLEGAISAADKVITQIET